MADKDPAKALAEAIADMFACTLGSVSYDQLEWKIRDAYAAQTTELAKLKRAYEHGLKTLWNGVPIDKLDRDADSRDIYEYVIAELTTAKAELETLREATHDWSCGCGHWNGPNLEFCAMCGRTPGDKVVMKQQ